LEEFKSWSPFNINDILERRKQRAKKYPFEVQRKAKPFTKNDIRFQSLLTKRMRKE